jgi:5'-nucleotidase
MPMHRPTTPAHRSSGRRLRRVALASVALGTIGLVAALGSPAVAAADVNATADVSASADLTSIDIVDVNDFHGRIESEGTTPTSAAGAALLAGVVDRYRAANPNTLFVSAGDNVGASTFTSLVQQDQPTIDVLNQMGLAVSAIGNHELDKGQDDLRNRIEPAADFDYVSANIVDSTTGEPAFAPFSVQTVDEGGAAPIRIGFIGATTELIPELVSPSGIEGLAMADVVDSVNVVADDLTDGDPDNGEADVLMLLVHEGAATGALADSTDASDWSHIVSGVTPKVAAILSAHTHQTYDHSIASTTGPARPVIQTGSYGMNYGHLNLQVDTTDMSVASITSEVAPVNGSGATPNAAVAATVASAVATANVEGAKKLGDITADLPRAAQSDGSENRGGESPMGNFVAEVQRWATADRNGAQIAFMNPGGLRTDILYKSSGAGDPDGNVTYKEAAVVQPFANTLVVLDLTGAQIKAALEQQWQPAGSSRPFLKLGVSEGFSATYDPTLPAGSRITGMTLNGTAIDPASTYKVTVNSFLASGGDNFTAFNGAAAKADSGQVDLQAQVDYFAAHPVVTPPLDQRSVGVHVGAAPAGGFTAGSTVTLDLSSLTFSRAGAQGGTATVSYGGQQLASAQIDPTVVNTTDEQGRATLTFTVPAAAAPGLLTAAAAVQPAQFVVAFGTQQVVVPITVVAAAVVDPGAGNGAGPGAGTGAGAVTPVGSGTAAAGRAGARSGALAYTGGTVVAPAVLAGALLVSGLAMLLVRRRRARLDGAAAAPLAD